MSETKNPKKIMRDYRQLTVRVESDKFKKLKMQLLEQDRTLQEWVNTHLDSEISNSEREDKRAA